MKKYKWDVVKRDELAPLTLSPGEIAELEAAYQEWKKQLDEAIASGDQNRIEEILELGA